MGDNLFHRVLLKSTFSTLMSIRCLIDSVGINSFPVKVQSFLFWERRERGDDRDVDEPQGSSAQKDYGRNDRHREHDASGGKEFPPKPVEPLQVLRSFLEAVQYLHRDEDEHPRENAHTNDVVEKRHQ